MDKQKINFAEYADMHEEVNVTGKDGAEITVRNHIPYAQKEAFAKEWAEQTLVVHDDSCVFESHEERKLEIFLTAKYYTDIDTEEATPEEVADFLLNDGLWEKVDEITGDDGSEVWQIYNRITSGFKKTFHDDVSLAKAVRTSFGFLFNGEDITESMAKAEMTKDTVYKAITALNEKEQEAAKQIDNGKAKIGGTLLNFARKQE